MRARPGRNWVRLGALVGAGALAAGAVIAAAGPMAAAAPQPRHIPRGTPRYATLGGATVLPTTETIPHWHGTFTDPLNGVTYGYNMVGNGDPSTYSGTTTVPTEIVPMNFVFSTGTSFDGATTVTATVTSPVFQDNTYSFAKVTATGKSKPLSAAGDTQLEDAVMRSQFNDVGTSTFHLLLGTPTVLPAQTISVPADRGVLASFGQGYRAFGDVNITWFAARMNNLIDSLHISPTTLPIFLTDNVYLYVGRTFTTCCVLGFHGAAEVTGRGGGRVHGSGNQGVQTYIYAAYAMPGTWATAPTPQPNTTMTHAFSLFSSIQDIHALSHEVSEWADDPFTNNAVQPWKTPTAPQYGCSGLLETGDPVVGIAVLIGHNPYFQKAGQNADGYWHPEDEVFLPWFARQKPNTTSEPLQGATGTRTGRYTFFGDLNGYPGFQAPATGCTT